MSFTIVYNPDLISMEQIIQLLTYAGRFVGIGGHRPSVKAAGNYGMWEVISFEG